MESSPAPGSLWFLSPAGKELVRPQTHETPTSNILNPAGVSPSPLPTPPKLKADGTLSPHRLLFSVFSYSTLSKIAFARSLFGVE